MKFIINKVYFNKLHKYPIKEVVFFKCKYLTENIAWLSMIDSKGENLPIPIDKNNFLDWQEDNLYGLLYG